MGFLTHLRESQIETANAAVSRQDAILDDYLGWLRNGPSRGRAERKITIIARDPLAPIVTAVVARTDILRAEGVTVEVILSQTEPEAALNDLNEALMTLNNDLNQDEYVRWAKKSALLDAHEQLTLGTQMCWSGDSMRREPGKRDSLDLFEQEAPHTVRLGLLAFEAIWSVSDCLPRSLSVQGLNRRPQASKAQPADTTLPRSSLISRLRLAATWH